MRDNGLFWYQKQMKPNEPTCLASELCETAMELLRMSYRWQNPLAQHWYPRCDLIQATTPKQLKLFEDEAEREKLEQLELKRSNYDPDADSVITPSTALS